MKKLYLLFILLVVPAVALGADLLRPQTGDLVNYSLTLSTSGLTVATTTNPTTVLFSVPSTLYVAQLTATSTTATSTIPLLSTTNIAVTGLNISGALRVDTSGTSTFAGGISGTQLNLTGITATDLLLSGKITNTGSATSTIPNLRASTLIHADNFYVSDNGTSSIAENNSLTKGNLTVGSGFTLRGGDLFLSSGKITQVSTATSTITQLTATTINTTGLNISGALRVDTSGTSTFVGGISGTQLNITGINLSQDLLSAGKLTVTSAATSTLPNLNVSTLLNTAALFVAGPISLSGKVDSTSTATSSFLGGLVASSTVFSIASSNGRISLGTTTQSDADVANTGTVDAALTINGLGSAFNGTSTVYFAGRSGKGGQLIITNTDSKCTSITFTAGAGAIGTAPIMTMKIVSCPK